MTGQDRSAREHAATVAITPSSPRLRCDADRVGVLGPRAKAVPVDAWGTSGSAFVAARPSLAAMPTPLLTLDAGAAAGNIAAMAAWARGAGVDLAPHGKTTMAPALWRAQLAAGAWGLTVATPWQLAVALDELADLPAGGARLRLLAAYPVLEPAVLALLARPRAARVLCWADGLDVVAAMAERGPGTGGGPAQPLDVLVELGAPAGRTGARSVPAALDVARAVAAAPGLRLAGVTGYEGALAHDAGPQSLARVRAWLGDLAALHGELLATGLYEQVASAGEEVVVSAGGSAFLDDVATALAPLHDPRGGRGPATRVVVRPGAYVAHDDGYYRGITPSTRGADLPLRAALNAWGRVVSRPEPGLALLDVGKRDVGVDEGLPVVQAVRRGGDGATTPLAGAQVVAVNDQHAFVRLDGGAEDLAVGDVVRLGVSHPCTSFDRWSLLPVLDDAGAAQPVVVDLLATVFG